MEDFHAGNDEDIHQVVEMGLSAVETEKKDLQVCQGDWI